jgi:glycosyltransferase involved in cell wall biosynthesis
MNPVVVCASHVDGGGERYLRSLYGEIHKRGHMPTLVGSIPEWPRPLGLCDPEFGPKWGSRTVLPGLMHLPAERRRVEALIRNLQPTFFHVQYKREQIGLTDLLARRAPVVWTEHGRLLPGGRGWLLGKAYQLAAKRAAVVVCVSPAVRDDVAHAVGQSVRTEVIENGVDTGYFRPPTPAERLAARAELGVPDLSPAVAWVGQLRASKRPLLALEVSRHLDGTMVVAGGGPEAPTVRSQASLHPNVICFGRKVEPRLVYHAADALLFTSTGAGEGLPLVLLEAAACGLPLLTHVGSGAEELVLQAGGRVVLDHPAKMGAALMDLLADQKPVAASRQWALEHSLERWTDEYLQLFMSL